MIKQVQEAQVRERVTAPAQLQEQVSALGSLVSERLRHVAAERQPSVLYDPVRYVLAGQGKALRPVLLLLSAQMYGVEKARALPVALAIEILHNWALVHDDIMDAAQTRRGRPAVHVRWGVNTALLTGDVLLGLAYEQLARVQPETLPALLSAFTRMVRSLCEGQAVDMQFETRADVVTPEYLDMIDLKTGALIAVSMEMGAILGRASKAEQSRIHSAGMALGRAFQIQDDLLDLIAVDGRWGKVIGGDLMEGKKTFLLLEALSRAKGEDKEFFGKIQHGRGLAAADIDDARSRMDRLGVFDFARKTVAYYTRRAVEAVESLPKRTEMLSALMQIMASRAH